MAVCSFIGHEEVYDADIGSRVQLAINQIVENQDSVEFLIYPHGEFYNICLLAVLRARTYQPQKVTITLVVQEGHQFASALDYLTDKTVSLYFEPPKKTDATFLHKKMLRWLIDNSTHLITYIYDRLYDPDNRLPKKQPVPKLISVSTPETEAAILEAVPHMREQEQIVFQRVQEDYTLKAIGQVLGVSYERARQLLYLGCRTIRKHLRHRWRECRTSEQRRRKHTCGLFALGEVSQGSLDRFKNVVDFLETTYGVGCFYVDQGLARSEYISALTEYSRKFHITAMVYDQLLAGSGDMLNDLAKLLCPPCHAMGCVSYADPKSITGSFCVIADLMERMDFCICDLSAMPHAERIRTYAAHTNRTVLLDMGGVNTGMGDEG